MKKIIEITDDLDCSTAYKDLRHPKSGGICVFMGTVRNHNRKKLVKSLYFEAYHLMAIKEMFIIAEEADANWNLNGVIIKHAIGLKDIEEPIVMVGASAAHRDTAFEACRFLIDELKKRVPIWKKQAYKVHEAWVDPHP